MTHSVWTLVFAYYGVAIASALMPWVNAELLMLSGIGVVGSRTSLAVLVLAVSAGQMSGKAIAYWLARRSTGVRSPRLQRTLDHWQRRFDRRPNYALAITFLSALVGVPPFFAVSLVAGALRVAFGRFMVVGGAGRLVHFSLVAFVPDLFWRTW